MIQDLTIFSIDPLPTNVSELVLVQNQKFSQFPKRWSAAGLPNWHVLGKKGMCLRAQTDTCGPSMNVPLAYFYAGC